MNELQLKMHHDVNDARPHILEHFVGQTNAVAKVKVALEASWNDGVRFPHTLLTGPPGLGKTQMASLIAAEMGVQIKEQLGQNLTTPADMKGFLLEAQEKDVLFIDEIELSPNVQVTLYRALEDSKVYISSSSKKSTHAITLPSFSLLAATSEPYMLLKPHRDRYKLLLAFDYYSQDELEQILRQRSQQLEWIVEEDVTTAIAERGRGTARSRRE
jgi:Holliday junction DNA helicase RuvB